MADNMKIVIRGLPFEAQKDQILQFFNLHEADVEVLTWPDSGRCKGVAFVECATLDEKARLEAFEGREFEADGNSRMISIRDYEERETHRKGRNKRQGGNRPRRRNQNTQNVDSESPEFEENNETEREVYVSNIPFEAKEDDFQQHFGQCGTIEEVTIPTRYTSGRPKGFAFVRFATVGGRNAALELDGSTMIERAIGVRENRGRVTNNNRPQRARRDSGLSEKPPGCLTIYVGNLPWAVDEDQLRGLFQSCGTIVSARVVRQSWTNRSRGFGYVEFQNEADVDTAVQMQLIVDERELRLDYASNLSNE